MEVVLVCVFLVFFGLILLTLFSKKVRRSSLSVFGVKTLKDYGEISEAYLTLSGIRMKQNITLLQCERNGDKFYALECTSTGFIRKLPTSRQIGWYRLSDTALDNLSQVIKNNS